MGHPGGYFFSPRRAATPSPGTLIGFVPISDAERSKSFYADVIGLEFVQDDGFALVFRSGANMVRLARAERVTPEPHTILGWEVGGIVAEVRRLAAAGVAFTRYGFLQQDEDGIWNSRSGNRVAWFTDPDGNVLSLSQHV